MFEWAIWPSPQRLKGNYGSTPLMGTKTGWSGGGVRGRVFRWYCIIDGDRGLLHRVDSFSTKASTNLWQSVWICTRARIKIKVKAWGRARGRGEGWILTGNIKRSWSLELGSFKLAHFGGVGRDYTSYCHFFHAVFFLNEILQRSSKCASAEKEGILNFPFQSTLFVLVSRKLLQQVRGSSEATEGNWFQSNIPGNLISNLFEPRS